MEENINLLFEKTGDEFAVSIENERILSKNPVIKIVYEDETSDEIYFKGATTRFFKNKKQIKEIHLTLENPKF